MNSEIKIVDNFLEESDFNEVTSFFKQNWKLQTSTPNQKELPFLYSELTGNSFFNSYLFYKIIEQLDGNEYKLERIYFNGQWSGREGTLHIDVCDFTALIYMSPYEYGWGGFTEIMTEPEPTLVYPIPNRLIIFPGNIDHKAYSFAYQTCPLRVTLAFKIIYNPNVAGNVVGDWR